MAKGLVYSSVDSAAPGIRGPETTVWDSSKWGANVLNASITGLFSALGSIGGVISSAKMYQIYQQQENYYLQNAAEQARRTQIKGDIALSNLRVKHATKEGTNELAVAAAGGNLSGSNLDKLVQNYKYDAVDERTSSLQTLWETSNIRRQGYIQAIGIAGQAMSTAYANRTSALTALGKFIGSFGTAIAKDVDSYNKQNYQTTTDALTHNAQMKALERYYGSPKTVSGTVVDSGSSLLLNTDSAESETLIYNPNEPTFINNPVNSSGLLDIWVNEDGSMR